AAAPTTDPADTADHENDSHGHGIQHPSQQSPQGTTSAPASPRGSSNPWPIPSAHLLVEGMAGRLPSTEVEGCLHRLLKEVPLLAVRGDGRVHSSEGTGWGLKGGRGGEGRGLRPGLALMLICTLLSNPGMGLPGVLPTTAPPGEGGGGGDGDKHHDAWGSVEPGWLRFNPSEVQALVQLILLASTKEDRGEKHQSGVRKKTLREGVPVKGGSVCKQGTVKKETEGEEAGEEEGVGGQEQNGEGGEGELKVGARLKEEEREVEWEEEPKEISLAGSSKEGLSTGRGGGRSPEHDWEEEGDGEEEGLLQEDWVRLLASACVGAPSKLHAAGEALLAAREGSDQEEGERLSGAPRVMAPVALEPRVKTLEHEVKAEVWQEG
ncbi:unnamed protein product, partial [Discosporangium mesarthrocarpum]